MPHRLAILTVAALLPVSGVAASVAVAGQAQAVTIGKVTLTGTVEDCDDESSPDTVTIKAGTETKTDNSLAGNSNSYSVTFKKIAKNATVTAKATVTCESEDTYKQSFSLKGSPNTDPVKRKQNLEP
ncbi:hypothetical protein J2X68_007648 [Streptomyces sp. 3330]|uniref:hypothetical protein n=1 Tax=Streptomyces sp. 3330 TaxID=2817755 RepID=UPI0028655301|nr:hypothetical protein [Streptomyces sp. 3330]MDR6980906.1 hypothetical protein [Streptomyces sp. 3330]